MLLDYETLKLIWWVLVGALLIGFAITDGMDLGVGNVLPFIAKTDEERRVVINTVGPHWDGNQVWLITAGGALFAAWPIVYATVFSGFYFAMILVLFGLFFRPVGFDYRSKIEDTRWRNTWDWGLFVGGFVPSLIFGVAFGNLIRGVPFEFNELLQSNYTGSFFGLLNPFAILAGLVSVAMLTMHGSIWLQLRTEDLIANRAKQYVQWAGIATIATFILAGIWVAFGIKGYTIVEQPPLDALPNPLNKTVEHTAGAWMQVYKDMPWTLIFPLLGIGSALMTMFMSRINRPGWGFVGSSLTMTGIILTAGVSMFPFIMPSISNPDMSLTLWDAPSSHLTLTVMFWAVVIFLPIVIAYTVWCYAKMWRKVSIEEIRAQSHQAY
ncbi:MAG: cytochrome d ubiquinol oxidase subunit II [Thiotrichales bacterium]